MKASIFIKTLIILSATGGLPLAAYANADPAQANSTPQIQASDQPSIQLGNIQVKGQKQIIKTLQAIKIALRQPESSDPKLADVVVCRIKNDIGSYASYILTCATNRILAKRRDQTQTALAVALSGPSGGGDAAFFSVLHSMLMNQPGNYLHTTVNGPALRALLQKIPDPPAAAPVESGH